MQAVALNSATAARPTPGVEATAPAGSRASVSSSPSPRPATAAIGVDALQTKDDASSSVQVKDATAPSKLPAQDNADEDDPTSALTAGAAPATAPTVNSKVQAVAQALASAVQQVSPKSSDAATEHAPAPIAASSQPDPAAATTASAGGSFGTVSGYTPEGRVSVQTPVGQPGFGQELSERVVVLARGGVQTAQLSLDPSGLGPVGVSIQVHGHTATLAFTAAHEATRGALEAALPRLREMFAANGMQLSDATVGGRSNPEWSAQADARTPNGQRGGNGGPDPGVMAPVDATEAAAAPASTVRRLVDIYA
jgi:flagellar hook-length control protein FliK